MGVTERVETGAASGARVPQSQAEPMADAFREMFDADKTLLCTAPNWGNSRPYPGLSYTFYGPWGESWELRGETRGSGGGPLLRGFGTGIEYS